MQKLGDCDEILVFSGINNIAFNLFLLSRPANPELLGRVMDRLVKGASCLLDIVELSFE